MTVQARSLGIVCPKCAEVRMSCGDEVEGVGGELDDARLRRIASRAWRLRNRAVAEREAFEFGEREVNRGDGPHLRCVGDAPFEGGETPTLVDDEGDGGETRMPSIELHVGCGDHCGIMAICPWDGDMGGTDRPMAEAIAHAGRDMLDLVREVLRLRAVGQELVGRVDRLRGEVVRLESIMDDRR